MAGASGGDHIYEKVLLHPGACGVCLIERHTAFERVYPCHMANDGPLVCVKCTNCGVSKNQLNFGMKMVVRRNPIRE